MTPENKIYIAIGPYCWGKGFSRKQAIDAMRKEWSQTYAGKFSVKKYKVYICFDPWAVIDDMGGICYTPIVGYDGPMCKEAPIAL